MLLCYHFERSSLALPLSLVARRIEEVKMTRFKFLLFVALLAGFTTLAHAGFDSGKAAYDRGDYARAYKAFKPLAERGDIDAQFYLGVMYDFGRGVSQDYIKAAKWFRKAAERGDGEAQFELGWAYAEGQGVAQDYAEAIKWYRKSAQQGFPPAQRELGGLYANGQGVPQDHAEAIKWYRKAAEQGDDQAQFELGWAYTDGNSVPQDFIQAYMWFDLAAAHENDSYAEDYAGDFRDNLAEKMTPAQIAEAGRLAREWKPKGGD
jgi:uncharacterized protein